MTSSRHSVLRIPNRLVVGVAAFDAFLALVVFAPWQLVVVVVVLAVFALGYRVGRS